MMNNKGLSNVKGAKDFSLAFFLCRKRRHSVTELHCHRRDSFQKGGVAELNDILEYPLMPLLYYNSSN
jgi:hypothetical protein